MANTSVIYFDSDFVRLRRGNFNCLDAQILAGLPCNGRLSSLSTSLAQNGSNSYFTDLTGDRLKDDENQRTKL